MWGSVLSRCEWPLIATFHLPQAVRELFSSLWRNSMLRRLSVCPAITLSLLESRYMLVTMWNCFNIAVWHVTPSLMYIFNESPSPPRVSITCQMPYQILAVLQPALSLRKKPTSPSSRYCHTTCAPCHGLSHSHYLVNVSSPFRGYTGKIRGSMRLVFATHCSYHISQLFIGWRVDRRTRALRF